MLKNGCHLYETICKVSDGDKIYVQHENELITMPTSFNIQWLTLLNFAVGFFICPYTFLIFQEMAGC